MSRAHLTRRGDDGWDPSTADRSRAVTRRRGARGARIVGAAVATTAAAIVLAGPASATWSVVGTDPATGQVGAAVASCTDVRDLTTTMALVPKTGGAVSVGASADTAPVLLATGLRAGSTPSQVALAARGTEAASSAELRQYGVAVLGSGAGTSTGADTGTASGGRLSADGTAAVQGNLVASGAVLDATKRGFDTTSGPLATRLVAALRAGAAAGGDRSCGKDARAAAVVVLGTDSSLFVPAASPVGTNASDLLRSGDLTAAQLADRLAQDSVRPAPRGAHAPALYLSAVVPQGADALGVIESRYAGILAAENRRPAPATGEIVDPSYSRGLMVAALILFGVLGLVIAALIIGGLRRAESRAALAADADADALARSPFRDEVANLFDLDIAATIRRGREAERRRQVLKDKDRGRERAWSGTTW